MLRRYLAWMDRGNPVRGRSPRYVFCATLFWYGAAIGFLWLVNMDDATEGGPVLFWFTVAWFTWVWRA